MYEEIAARHSITVDDVVVLSGLLQHGELQSFITDEVLSSATAKHFVNVYKECGLRGVQQAQLGMLYADLVSCFVPYSVDELRRYIDDCSVQNIASELCRVLYEKTVTQKSRGDELRSIIMDYVHRLCSYSTSQQARLFADVLGEAVQRSRTESAGMLVPFSGLRQYVPRLKSDMMVVGARTSVGKTSFALDLARRIAFTGEGSVYIVSLEMDKYAIAARLASAILRRNYYDVCKTVSDAEVRWLRDYNIYIQDSVQNVAENIPVVFAEAYAKKCNVVVLDYIQLMYARRKSDRRDLEIGYASSLIRESIKRYGVSAIVLAQLNRLVEMRSDKKPRLSDLRDSGSLEMDADIVCLLSREDDTLCVNVAKNRNGSVGEFMLHFDKNTMTFDEVL